MAPTAPGEWQPSQLKAPNNFSPSAADRASPEEGLTSLPAGGGLPPANTCCGYNTAGGTGSCAAVTNRARAGAAAVRVCVQVTSVSRSEGEEPYDASLARVPRDVRHEARRRPYIGWIIGFDVAG